MFLNHLPASLLLKPNVIDLKLVDSYSDHSTDLLNAVVGRKAVFHRSGRHSAFFYWHGKMITEQRQK